MMHTERRFETLGNQGILVPVFYDRTELRTVATSGKRKTKASHEEK